MPSEPRIVLGRVDARRPDVRIAGVVVEFIDQRRPGAHLDRPVAEREALEVREDVMAFRAVDDQQIVREAERVVRQVAGEADRVGAAAAVRESIAARRNDKIVAAEPVQRIVAAGADHEVVAARAGGQVDEGQPPLERAVLQIVLQRIDARGRNVRVRLQIGILVEQGRRVSSLACTEGEVMRERIDSRRRDVGTVGEIEGRAEQAIRLAAFLRAEL